MRKGDLIWSAILLVIILFLVIEPTRKMYASFTGSYVYISGFLKYMVLASLGELLSIRLKEKSWRKSTGFFVKALVWGALGVAITFVFRFYTEGVRSMQGQGLLIGGDYKITAAFFTSLIMNLTFGIALFISHKITDEVIEYRIYNSGFAPLSKMIKEVDWPVYVVFILKMLAFFWVPVHTMVFLLPEIYRVLAAAFLSIVLGILLTIGTRGQNKEKILA